MDEGGGDAEMVGGRADGRMGAVGQDVARWAPQDGVGWGRMG